MNQLIVTICACAVSAVAQVTAPQIGIATDAQGRLRPVTGIAGNFIAGAPLATGVLSAAASDTAALAKTSSAILLVEKGSTLRTIAPAGPALFAFTIDGAPAFAWLAGERALLRWNGSGFPAAALETAAIPGDVVSIGADDSAHVRMTVIRNGGVEILRVRLSDGSIAGTTPLPANTVMAMLMPDGGVVYALPNAIVLRDAAGDERRIPFSSAVSALTPISSRWLLIGTTGVRRYGLRLRDGAVFQLPEVR